ncbi:MAG: hypothetical protein GY868_13825 [Deltaproteobacteria bacterium]|nr:hypothetical protein [Deltaproteobacteria bacterium]
MKQMQGLDFWVKSSIWLELAVPGYFFGKTFGTADAKFRFIDNLMYPRMFMDFCGYFRDMTDSYYLGRFYGVFSGAVLGVLVALLIGVFYKWVMKDWAYAKAARIGAVSFILIALLTGFMSDMFCESMGMGLKIDKDAPGELVGKYLLEDYGSFKKGTQITEQNAHLLTWYGKVRANSPASTKRWWIASIIFMYSWFVLYFLCSQRLFKRNRVPRTYWFKLHMINLAVVIIYLRMGFGISPSEYNFILTRAPYLMGG